MARISAAANRGVRRTTAVAALLAVVALVPASARTAPRAVPPIQVTPHELRLVQPVLNLSADHGRAAFVFCQQLVGVWRPGATHVVRLGRLNLWTCPPPTSAESIQSLAIAKDRIAWAVDDGGNIIDNWVFVTTLATPHTLTGVKNIAHCCRGEPDSERIGYTYGDGKFLAFGTRYKCGDQGTPSCPPSSGTGFHDYSTWRIRRAPFRHRTASTRRDLAAVSPALRRRWNHCRSAATVSRFVAQTARSSSATGTASWSTRSRRSPA